MRLIIAEKPSLARAIASALDTKHKKTDSGLVCEFGATQQADRKNVSSKVIVTWLLGHVLEQYEPDDYCDEWKKWSLEALPIVPNEWKLKEVKSAKSVIVNVKKLLKEAHEVVHAGDPDREGELLVDEFLEFFKWKGKTSRLLLKDLTPDAIRKAFASMSDVSEFAGLKNAALARQRADWLVGMNGSRFFTIMGRLKDKSSGVISVGRVQTPTLGLVARRDTSIENFTPVAYYIISATLSLHARGGNSVTGVWQPESLTEKLSAAFDEERRLTDMNLAA
jgi:DNA topoisomerase-3